MVVTHYAYLTVKMPGPAGPISMPAETDSTISCAEQLYSALVSAQAEVKGHLGGSRPSSSKPRFTVDASIPTKEVVWVKTLPRSSESAVT